MGTGALRGYSCGIAGQAQGEAGLPCLMVACYPNKATHLGLCFLFYFSSEALSVFAGSVLSPQNPALRAWGQG